MRNPERMSVPRTQPFCFTSGLILLLGCLLTVSLAHAQGNPPIRDINIDPPYIYAGVPCWVLVSATIPPDVTRFNTNFKLLRLDETGAPRVIEEGGASKVVVGMLVKDGSLQIPLRFNETKPGVMKLQVSADYTGGTKEVSEVFSLRVEPKPDLKAIEATWHEFAKKMVNKDLDGAAQCLAESKRKSFKKDTSEIGMRKVSTWYKTVRDLELVMLKPGVIEFYFKITMDWGKDYDARVAFKPDADGTWRIHVIGYAEAG